VVLAALIGAVASQCGSPVEFYAIQDSSCNGGPTTIFPATGPTCANGGSGSVQYDSCVNGVAYLKSWSQVDCTGTSTLQACNVACSSIQVSVHNFGCRFAPPPPSAAPTAPTPQAPTVAAPTAPTTAACVNAQIFKSADCSGPIASAITADPSCVEFNTFISFKHQASNTCSATSHQMTVYIESGCNPIQGTLLHTCSSTCSEIVPVVAGSYGASKYSCKIGAFNQQTSFPTPVPQSANTSSSSPLASPFLMAFVCLVTVFAWSS